MPSEKGRAKDLCSACGKKLPENRIGWGLVWQDGSGMCAKCLYHYRKEGGFFKERKRKLEKSKLKDNGGG
tara:strand:- start:8331 stop:8540 length:210 start_codon:yes stop_codon:yes gene_type:complete